MKSVAIEDYNCLSDCGLFSANWYAAAYPDVAISGLDPLQHYLLIGAGLGRDPHPLFSSKHYLRQIQPSDSTVNPVVHYVRHGWRVGLDPHPAFDTDWYLATYPDVAAIELEPLGHFISDGAREMRRPHPLFDTEKVYAQFPFLISSGINPLCHYLEGGWDTDPCPLFGEYWAREEDKLVADEEAGQRIPFVPLHDVEPDKVKPGGWISTGIDPAFLVSFELMHAPSSGWYRLVVCAEIPSSVRAGALYVDYGEGFSQEACFIVPYKKTHAASRLVFFARTPKAIRFDPIDQTGHFTIHRFEFLPVAPHLAPIIVRLHLNDLGAPGALMDITPTSRQGDSEEEITRLLRLYENSFHSFSPDYQSWIERVEEPSIPSAGQIRANIAEFSFRPLISVIVPVYETPEKYLRACIDSVVGQSYPHWELCLADDASKGPHVRRILEEYAASDPRIKVVFREDGGHISEASNSTLSLATGEFVAFLDHDDVLPEHALYFLAEEINRFPQSMIVYSDEDKLDTSGERVEPHFKSDWNPDLLFSQNYICHLCAYRHSLVREVGGLRTGVEGSQDHDLLLRCLPHVHWEAIRHIPRILYHWRIHPESTASSSAGKDYTTRAGAKALSDYFAAHGPPDVRVGEGLLPNTYRVHWPVPEPEPLVSLLIPTRDRLELVEKAVSSILDRTEYRNIEIIILDNGSSEAQTLRYFTDVQKRELRVRVLSYDGPFNFSAINNFGVTAARGELVGFINNDIEVISPGWLREMVSHAIRPDIGCVGAKLYYSNQTIQHGGVILGIGGVAGHSHKHFAENHPGYFSRLMLTQNISAVTAACLLVRKSLFLQVGCFDDEHLTVAFNDVDLCLKVREEGYRNLWTPYAELYHHESLSRGEENSPEKIKRFQSEIRYMKEKWGDALLQDPYYNAHLTREREDFSLS